MSRPPQPPYWVQQEEKRKRRREFWEAILIVLAWVGIVGFSWLVVATVMQVVWGLLGR